MRRPTRTHKTRLLVCEGYGDTELSRTMRECYLPRGCGMILAVENARGGGGSNALKIALRLQKETAHDNYGALIDTDRHWDDDDRRRARDAGIVCIESSPCLEATLLAVAGLHVHATTQENKEEFFRAFGAPAHRAGVIARNFSAVMFDAARARVPAIDSFLRFIGR